MWLFNDEFENSYPSAFVDSLVAVLDNGRVSSPRGLETKELDHVTFKIDPKKSLYTSPIRDLNFFFLIAENLWYWSGRNSTEIPSYYVKNYRQFSDNNIHQGAYGPMILEQIRYALNCLKNDEDTRQAVIQLWRPNPQDAKDKPCTLSFDFKIRDGRLNMHATMRSNDALWGNNYDIPSFSMIQIAVAGMLGIPTGFLYLTAHSYHIYSRHYELAEKLINESWHCSDYPEELEMTSLYNVPLDKHVVAIENLLQHHYLSQTKQFTWNAQTSQPFYDQYAIMMDLFNQKDNQELFDLNIKKLEAIKSPFGIIYHERNINKK